jgi:RNAse (barnase) inhibitor barstar
MPMSDDWLKVVPAPAALDADLRVHRVRGRASRTRPTLFSELSRSLPFPAYFGHNWDALASVFDRLREPLTVVVENADRLLADEPPDQFLNFLWVLARAAHLHPELQIVLSAPAPHLGPLRSRVATAIA